MCGDSSISLQSLLSTPVLQGWLILLSPFIIQQELLKLCFQSQLLCLVLIKSWYDVAWTVKIWARKLTAHIRF